MFESLAKIRIGSRASKLAMIQVAEVKNLLLSKTHLTENQIEIIYITTSGDKIQDKSLAEIGGKGLFIKELEEALIQNKIDIAIHSAKDVPPLLATGTAIAAFTKRKDPRDYFVSQKFNSIQSLPIGAVVGTASSRRKACLLRLRPDLKIINFRGNVDSRITKLENNEVDATILALCGLMRMEKRIDQNNIISHESMLPAAGQGCLVVQVRQHDHKIYDVVRKINDEESEICVETERKFLLEIGASCKTPVAAYCNIEKGILNLKTIIFDFDGTEIFSTEFSGAKGDELAKKSANEVKIKAEALLKKII